ncbi:MAG TPA: molybdopterin-dependent oxidoreductase [Fimbriimonas sp.]|nr:molybdopterin-dependent oxidoreductase [Fimbriimonas sp.]
MDDDQAMRKMSRRSFIWAGVAVAGALGGLSWINNRASDADGVKRPFREALLLSEGVWSALYSPDRLVPTYDPGRRTAERVNGRYGLTKDFDPSKWTLTVLGVHGQTKPVVLKMEDILKLPSMEMTTEFFCIEGWSIIQTFKGVPFREFMKLYPPGTLSGSAPDIENRPHDLLPYVGMETPDPAPADESDDSADDSSSDSSSSQDDSSDDSASANDDASDSADDGDDEEDPETRRERATKYFVGLDVASALHPQTMLCYELNGKPLTLDHGAPLRLVIPTKYGVKNIKRIGAITYSKTRPEDLWAKDGYDWYAGL